MAMINRYQGNSGRMERFHEPEERKNARAQPAAQKNQSKKPPPAQTKAKTNPLLGLESLTKLLPEKIGELETEDYILLLILYLMYRESGDSELLIIMGAMFLM